MTANPAEPRDELDEILEGYYRWIVETVNPEVIGTGNAPLLKPTEAKRRLMAWHNRGVNEVLQNVVKQAVLNKTSVSIEIAARLNQPQEES